MHTLLQKLDFKQLERATNMLKAVAHPIRMSIVDLLEGGRKLSVTEIFTALDIEQSVASHHLSILKTRGVLESERDGKSTNYFLAHDDLIQVVDCLVSCCSRNSV